MIGAIIGDTIGSIYEFNNIKTKDFDFWGEGIEPTDDSVLTFATANWLLHGGEAWRHYCDFATEYDNPMGEYGSGFLQFVANARRGGKPQPYNSCGNGSAMRVGPVGWAFNTMDEVLERARVSAECSHN
ncbi:ADP-ribosylglycohydrolase family protein, partial [Fibrobacter sp.]|uniref:ADP-ribosylglycohydrolase family protein n=1 Tax=Fibrobacter sp. TaxID=35828 RepID=UPI0025C3F3FF